MFYREHRYNLLAFSLLVLALLCLPEAAFAVGGLTRVNDFMQLILGVLQGVSIAVVTIAIMWVGYKFLFKHADIMECAKILGGGLLIGGAAELARYFLAP